MVRKLVTVQRVESIAPIENADAIERATVKGWNIVVKRGEFRPGDRCVFFEIDSVLPSDAGWAQFMAPRGFRVKTVKLRGCLSQGLVLPMHILAKGDHGSYRIDDDVTGELGVVKYEPPVPIGHDDISGPFPGDVPKTDEMRVQSAPGVIDELLGGPFYITVKMDGMSGTFIKRDDGLQVCSRNWSLQRGDSPYWRVAAKYRLDEVLPTGMCIQGEVCGPGIQKNIMGLAEHELFVFSVYDVRTSSYLSFEEMRAFCDGKGLTMVPIEAIVTGPSLDVFPRGIDALLEMAKGRYPGSNRHREGLVFRPIVEAPSAVLGGRLSFKCINNDYLLKEED